MTLNEYGAQPVLRRLFCVQTALIAVWAIAILWGERWVFQSDLERCNWRRWENWPSEANPHHVVLIADPQLVDPHTYPGRPWPLSTLTIKYTDLYLKRSYRLLQERLQPDSLFFLGDLFDGGREWGAPRTAEKRYKKYGNKFWMKEYARFVKMFPRGWRNSGSSSGSEPRGRKLISSLPGNHDLGFANGISPIVKERFDAYFGPLNRLDVVANHTFVSLDTVSLSAMDQPDPGTGGSGAGDGTAADAANSAIWKPVHDFLNDGKNIRRRAVQREVAYLTDAPDQYYAQDQLAALSPSVIDIDTASRIHRHIPHNVPPTSSFPTILLTHVPLFRPASTDCGPMRERGHALSLTSGFQYQNVLTPLISQDVISKLGAEEVTQVYSGDDHDFCEVEHNEFTGRIREITVKSMSWAMGVRRPGFLAVSLWNPIDLSQSKQSDQNVGMPKDTIQNHLCLLPDQLAIFIRYAQLLALSLLCLVAGTIRSRSRKTWTAKSEPLLPLSEHLHKTSISSQTSAVSASPLSGDAYLSTRSAVRSTVPSASPSTLGGYGNLPASSRSSSPVKGSVGPLPRATHVKRGLADDVSVDDWGMPSRERSAGSRGRTFLQQLGRNLWQTAVPVLLFYLWMIWSG